MTARVLVVDDVDANVKLLEARLTADYIEVRTARSSLEASSRGNPPNHPQNFVAGLGFST